jgi:SAM-dependent methyltransferase
MVREMGENPNTRRYWEHRFSTGDWESKGGRSQTESFAKGQIPHLKIPRDFAGAILDFGCGLGDAMPVYRENYPKARLIGVDISESAIDMCRRKYGAIASFIQGESASVPEVDIVIASNVFEHLTDDRGIAKSLLDKCKTLYVIVPYREWPLFSEHVNTYDKNYFSSIGKYECEIFPCAGFSQFGLRGLWYQIYLKNIFRLLLGRPVVRRNMQIIYHFDASKLHE